MKVQFITDSMGNKNGVLLALNDWLKIQAELEELKTLRNKQDFFKGLKDAFEEVSLIKAGKKKPNSIEDLLNEI